MQNFLYKKLVDWSCLNLGINIPLDLHVAFYNKLNLQLKRGENCKIKLILNNAEYHATLYNIYFDENKYHNHKDLLQIRYTPNSPIAKKLQELFISSYSYLSEQKNLLGKTRKQIKVPKELSEFLILYTTEFSDVFLCDFLISNELSDINNNISDLNEMELEAVLAQESNKSSIVEKYQLTKIRKLDNAVNNKLKSIYEYRCQICGEKIGEKYDSKLIHAHHIEKFSLTMNNLPQNIMIVCPNHHGIIHSVHPEFDRNAKTFVYQNGYKEKLKINYHL